MEVSGWFTKQTTQQGKKKENLVVPTPEFMAIKDEVMATAELFSPIAYPMLIQPNDWSENRQGGYLLNEVMRGHDMVRRGNVGCIQGEGRVDPTPVGRKTVINMTPSFFINIQVERSETDIP